MAAYDIDNYQVKKKKFCFHVIVLTDNVLDATAKSGSVPLGYAKV